MSFFIFFALHVIAACFIGVLVTRIFSSNEAAEHLEQYLNIQENQTKALQYVFYAAWVAFGVLVLGLFFPVFIIIYLFAKLVLGIASWWWLVETIQAGVVAVWIEDTKKYFTKK